MTCVGIVEPNGAPCLFRSGEARDGAARAVTGEMETIMAGLNCGVPSVQGWPILRRTAAAFLSCEGHTLHCSNKTVECRKETQKLK